MWNTITKWHKLIETLYIERHFIYTKEKESQEEQISLTEGSGTQIISQYTTSTNCSTKDFDHNQTLF